MTCYTLDLVCGVVLMLSWWLLDTDAAVSDSEPWEFEASASQDKSVVLSVQYVALKERHCWSVYDCCMHRFLRLPVYVCVC